MHVRQLLAGMFVLGASVSGTAQEPATDRFVVACKIAMSVKAPQDLDEFEMDVRQVHRQVSITVYSADRSQSQTGVCLFRDLSDEVPELLSVSTGDITLTAADNPEFNEAIWNHFVPAP